jgi:protein TonB
MEIKKNPKVDLERKKRTFGLIGLVLSLSFMLLAFEWRFYEAKLADLGDLNLGDIEEEIIPITQQNQPPPPPPPPPPVQEVIQIVEDDVEIEEELEMEDTEADENTIIEAIEIEEEVVEEQIFTIVEDMPAFQGCENIQDKAERTACTQQKMYQFLGKIQTYPEIAREAGIQGTVYVSFVVGKDGKVGMVEILKGVSGGSMLDKEAVRMISQLPAFTPGKQRGKAVQVKYNLPVRFKLK